MGALTSNRKRGDGYFSLTYPISSPCCPDSDFRTDIHISKKPRISSMHPSPYQFVPSQNSVSKNRCYPEPKQGFRRELHAPCRKPKFVFSSISNRESGLKGNQDSATMGNVLSSRYDEAKSSALGAFRYLGKDKMVTDVDVGCSKNVVSEDSSVEELYTLDDGREGRSVISEQKSHDTNGDVFSPETHTRLGDYSLRPSSSAYWPSPLSDLTNITPLKVDSVGKMTESLSGNRVVEEEVGMLPHVKLHASAEKRNSKLSSLFSQIKLQEQRWFSFILRRPVKKPEEDVPREPFVLLTTEEEDEVSHAFSGSNRRKVLVTHVNSNIEITGESLQCLREGAWLNDEVINVYLELLKEREIREPKKFLKCHFFNTFFYKRLISGKNGYDYKAVKRWTTQRKIGYGLIECDKIFVPIHKEIHWCLAVINKKDEKFQYLDSLKGMDTLVLQVLARYYEEEVKDKSGKDIDVSSWKLECVDDLPEQENGWDCGMFMIKYVDFYSRGLGLCFSQEHMPYFRMRTAKEILRLKAE